MKTPGALIVRFRGRCWMFNYSSDGYLHVMGQSLVQSIPTDRDEYQNWLKSQRDFYAKWDDLLHTFLSITQADLQHIEARFYEIHHHETDPVLEEAFSNKLTAFPNHHPTEYRQSAEYYYTIDLDLEVFSIGDAVYLLDSIPRNGQWMESLLIDGDGDYFVRPRLAPEASRANLAAITQHPMTERSTTMAKKAVIPKVPDTSNVLAKFQLKLFNIFRKHELDRLSVAVHSWKADDLAFREFAYNILCLALGGSYLAIIDDRRTIGLCRHGQPDRTWNEYRALIHGSDSDGERELLTSLGLGFHMEDQPLGTAPHASKYWLEGVLVCLVPRLEQPKVARYAMTEAIEYGRDVYDCSSFDAVLISIFDVVVLEYFPDGTVNHSSSLPLVRVRHCLGSDAKQRYSDTRRDDDLKRHRKIPCDSNEPTVSVAKEPEIRCLLPNDVVETSFLQLVNFLDSTAIASSISVGSSAYSIPPEVLSLILGFNRVRDTDFRAVILSSGQQMPISFSSKDRGDQDIYRYLVGSHRNRKTVSPRFFIRGLELPRPFKIPLSRPSNDGCAEVMIPDDGPWGEAAVRSHLNKANPDIRTLEDFWKAATELTIGHDFGLASNWHNIFHQRVYADWLLPPNSQHYFISTDLNPDHIYYRHYLMLMIKRGSRYWDCLWDDIIREAKEELVKVDDAEDFQRLDENGHEILRTPRSVGAANPSVILTVRLFKWRQSEDLSDANPHYDGMLTETEPGKVLSILNAEDREAIEVVLRAAVQRLQDAPKKGSAYWIKRP